MEGVLGGLEVTLFEAASALSRCDALLITAGAGMGVDSGLPDFRGNEGFWREYPVLSQLGLDFPSMANPRWFDTEPRLAWAFYGHRLDLYRTTRPHEGFLILLELSRRFRNGCFVYTSNVDGHFQRVGFDPARVVECHGSIHHLQCRKPCQMDIWDHPLTDLQINLEEFRANGVLPRCPTCGGMARPNVLMFGDNSWISNRTHLQERQLNAWLEDLLELRRRLAVIEIGAGTSIPTVRKHSEYLADQVNGVLVRINIREPEVPIGHFGIRAGGLEALRALRASFERLARR